MVSWRAGEPYCTVEALVSHTVREPVGWWAVMSD